MISVYVGVGYFTDGNPSVYCGTVTYPYWAHKPVTVINSGTKMPELPAEYKDRIRRALNEIYITEVVPLGVPNSFRFNLE